MIPDHAGGEPDAPPPAETSPAPDQYTQVRDSMRLAACQPYVRSYFNFLLADEPRLQGWQSGAFWADLTPKDSRPGFLAGDLGGERRHGRLRRAQGRTPERGLHAALGTNRPRCNGVGRPAPRRAHLEREQRRSELVGYRVYRDGAHVGTTSTASWTNVAVAPGYDLHLHGPRAGLRGQPRRRIDERDRHDARERPHRHLRLQRLRPTATSRATASAAGDDDHGTAEHPVGADDADGNGGP